MTIIDYMSKINYYVEFVYYTISSHFTFTRLIIFLIAISAFYILCKYYIFKEKTEIQNTIFNDYDGVVFGKKGFSYYFSPTNSEGHIAVFGGSGLGKTSALLIPTLRAWKGTSFTIDISGDICKNVPIGRKLVYEPENKDTIPYNLFGAIDLLQDDDAKNEALEQLSLLLLPDKPRMDGADRFFTQEGRKILTASFITFYHLGMEFVDICEKIVGSSWKALFTEIDDIGNEKAIMYINSFDGANETNTSGCKQAADGAIKLFATNETIKRSIHRPTNEKEKSFTPASIEKYNVFVVIDDSKLKLYSQLLHIITSQTMEFFSERSNDNKHMILLCLDEFASLGKLEIIDALRKLRKKHVRIMILTQSMADLDLCYGIEERKAMMNNFRFKVVLGASDSDTQKYFADLIGYVTKKRESVARSDGRTTRTTSEANVYAIEPAKLDHLKKNLIVLSPDGWIELKKNFYYA